MRAIVQEDPPSLKELNPRIPRELAMVIRGLLVKDAERRTSTGAEVAAQLSALLRGIPSGYLPAGRLLATVEDLDEKGNGTHPPVAAIPSVDWDGGARQADVSYDETRLVDPSAAATFAGGQTRAPLVGALELPEDQNEDDADLIAATVDIATDPAPPPSDPEVARLEAQATVLMMREDMVLPPPTEPAMAAAAAPAPSPDEVITISRTRSVSIPNLALPPASVHPPPEATPPYSSDAAATQRVTVLVADDEAEDDDLPRTVVMRAHGGSKSPLRAALLVGLASFAVTLALVAGLLFSGVVDLRRLGIKLGPRGAVPVEPVRIAPAQPAPPEPTSQASETAPIGGTPAP